MSRFKIFLRRLGLVSICLGVVLVSAGLGFVAGSVYAPFGVVWRQGGTEDVLGLYDRILPAPAMDMKDLEDEIGG